MMNYSTEDTSKPIGSRWSKHLELPHVLYMFPWFCVTNCVSVLYRLPRLQFRSTTCETAVL